MIFHSVLKGLCTQKTLYMLYKGNNVTPPTHFTMGKMYVNASGKIDSFENV